MPPKPTSLASLLSTQSPYCSAAKSIATMNRVAMSLFTAGTYGYQQADVFPRLALTSEMRRCGKSTALNCICHLAFSSEQG